MRLFQQKEALVPLLLMPVVVTHSERVLKPMN
jgi:hypothetical protein